MFEPEAHNSHSVLYGGENEVKEFYDADSLSTNENKQMDGEMEEMNEEGRLDTPSGDVILELDEELQAGYKILTDLMSHSKRAANWPFMDSIEETDSELFEVYKQRIEKPVWLKLMKQKFGEHQYTTITEFVSDFRLMLENCYRFNGPDHYISKRAQKMETMLEQKLALLPREFREKTTIDATTVQKADSVMSSSGMRRRPKSHVLHDSTYLLNQLREAEYQKKREYRIRQIMARRAERQALAQEIMDWEEQILFENKKELMRAMWEIPQIGLFLFLCQGPLNIGEIMHFELERCFMMVRESSTLQLIMSSLLSTPFQRLKMDRKKPMPYRVWEQRLRVKLQGWYKVYSDMGEDSEKTCFKLGIDELFFDIVGKKNPLERKKYHELGFYRKVWIMKSLCDNCLYQQDYLRETIENQPIEDQREYLLGTDNAGQRYIHFPQFCGADVRVYRQAPVKYPKLEIKPDPFNSKRKFPFVYKPPPMKKVKLKKKKRHRAPQSGPASENNSPMSSPQRQRPSNLRQAPKSVVPLQLLDDASSITEDASSSSSESENEDQSAAETLEPELANEPSTSAGVKNPDTEPDSQTIETDKDAEIDGQSVDRLSSGSDATLPYCDNSDTNSNMSSRDQSRDSSPYPSCSDLNLRFGSQIDRSSDVSQESSPCPSPADFGLRRSARNDRFSDTSRDASPLIFDADFGLRRSSRNRARLKNIPPLKAARDLSAFLFEENSASNSSLAGESSLSGMGTSLFKDDMTSRRSSKSSVVTEDNFDCDINVDRLFANSRTSHLSTDLGVNFHKVLESKHEDFLHDNFSSVQDNEGEEIGQSGEVKHMDEVLEDSSKDNSRDGKHLFKPDSNADSNSTDLSFEKLKDLQSKEKTMFDSFTVVNSINEETNSSMKDIYDKNENLNSDHQKPCNLNKGEGVATETDLDTVDLVNNTGKESVSVKFDSGSVFMSQSHDRLETAATNDDAENASVNGNCLNINRDEVGNMCHNFSEDSNETEDMKEIMRTDESMKINEVQNEMAEPKLGHVDVTEISDNRPENTDVLVIGKTTGNGDEDESLPKSFLKLTDDDIEINELMSIKSEPNSDSIDEAPNTEEKMPTYNVQTGDNFDTNEDSELGLHLLNSNSKECKVEIKTERDDPATDNIRAETKVEFVGTYADIDANSVKHEKTASEKAVEMEQMESVKIKAGLKIEKQEENEVDIKMKKEEDDKEDIKFEKQEGNEEHKEVKMEVEKQVESEEEEEEVIPDSRQFEMVADSVEEVRKLAEQFAEPEPIIIKRGKKEMVQRPPPRKKNIIILHERLQYLLKELEPWESKLQQASKRARLRLRKEMEDYLMKPSEEKDDDWKSTDEETESGESDAESKDDEEESKGKPKPPEDKASASNSRCSTPVKPPEEVDEIDISHRGRLRKRRIIPNNVEDQMAIKRPKQTKCEQTQTVPLSNHPVIVQSGKTQLVDYADIIRQIKNTGGTTPILIKSTQGGRTVLTSVLPVNTLSNNNSNTSTIPALPTLRVVSPSDISLQSTAASTMPPQALKIAVQCSGAMPMQITSKALQHPTIQNLLSGTVAGSRLLQKTSASVSVAGAVKPTEQPSVILHPTPEKAASQKVVLPIQTTPQKLIPSPVFTTPRKIAPHTTASDPPSGKPKAKYYAANASTLPINVVEQLIATRGAKLSQGAFNQSILLIPMESEGMTRNVVSSAPVTPVKCPLSPATTPNGKTIKSESTHTVSSTSSAKTSPNTLILPKPQTSPVLSLGQGLPGLPIQPALGGLQRPQAFLQPTVVDGVNVARLVPLGISPKSPTRYPNNETVKTLLEKRKPPEEKETSVLEKRKVVTVDKMSNTSNNGGLIIKAEHNASTSVSLTQTSPGMRDINLNQNNSGLGFMRNTSIKMNSAQPTIMTIDPVKSEALISPVKAQQCVITSISAAKLNTLLLQTSAAGAKSIPSLIKLPSKAALDSAVKAVVTSVNVTLPTVNIKVPSPTSLPSIGPRRNVTKTIQTMKSPIPVAPKFVTQTSGGQTTLSYADSHTTASSQMLTGSSSSVQNSASSAGIPANQSTIMTGSLDQEGKRVVTRLTPQLVLTSKGVMQMGFINTAPLAAATSSVSQAPVPSTAVQCGNQAVLIQNSAGQYQLVQQTSPLLQQAEQGTSLQQLANQSVTQSQGQGQNLIQAIKPVVALNASGNPIILPTVRPNSQLATSSPPSIVLHNSTYYSANQRKPLLNIVTTSSAIMSPAIAVSPGMPVNAELKSPSAGLLLQQASSSMLHSAQRPVVTQSGMVSPVLGLQQGLVLQGGVQLASPLVNQLGLNLLQPGLQALQNPSSLQTSSTPSYNLVQKAGTAGTQLLNINPLLLNTALTTTSGGVLRQQLNTQLGVASGNQIAAKIGLNTIVRPSTPTFQQPIKSPVLTTSVVQPTMAVGHNGTGLVSPLAQMVQMPGSSLVIPSLGSAQQQLNLLGQLATTPSPAQKQLVFQYPSIGQTGTAIATQPSQTVSNTAKLVVSLPNNPSGTVHAKTTLPVTKLQVPQKIQTKVVTTDGGHGVSSNDNLLTTVSVNQVTVGQKTSPSQQKLLLFSIGGQLVTGQGVPVSLNDGVLKVVPHGKIKINNQTLTPDQIKQTLTKINEAAAMTLNPTSQQQTVTCSVVDQGKVIPVKIVKDSKSVTVPVSVNSSMDHTYLNSNKEKVVTSLMNGDASVLAMSQNKPDPDIVATQTGFVLPNFQTGFQVVNPDSIKAEPGEDIQTPGQSKEKQYGLKPMGYSSGYVVRQRTSSREDCDEKPGFANQNFDIGKLVVDKEGKRFVIKAPAKSDLNGGGDASNNIINVKPEPKIKLEDDDEENDDKLVIDDGVSDKEAALNLLTLANQAPAPMVVKVENNE